MDITEFLLDSIVIFIILFFINDAQLLLYKSEYLIKVLDLSLAE